MNRRSILLGLGTAAAGAGAVFGSGAFTQVQADRDLTVRVDEDSNALLGITAGDNVASVYKDGGELAINTDELSADGEKQGFAVGSTVSIGGTNESGDVTTPAFTITNNFDDVGDGSADLDVGIDLTNIDLSTVSGLTSLEFYGTPSNGNGTQVTSAGGRSVFNVTSGQEIDFAIKFTTASTTGPADLDDATVAFQAGSDLTSGDFPTPQPVVRSSDEFSFTSIQAAIDDTDTNSDETLTVGAGTYDESVTINVDGLTLEAGDGVSPTITQDGTDVVTIEADNITIDGFVIEQQSLDKAGAVLADVGATEDATFTLENNEFTSGDTLVDIQQTDMGDADVTIADNTFDVANLSVSERDGLTYVADGSGDLVLDSDDPESNSVLGDNTFAPNRKLDDGNLALAENPIEDWDVLNNVRNKNRWDTPLVLVNDLDSGTAGYDDVVEDGFTPIPFFSGSFDGNGNTISDLQVDTDGKVGLFGFLFEQAVIRDLTIESVTITQQNPSDGDGTGAVAGYVQSSTIKNVDIEDTTVTSKDNIGSINHGIGSVGGYGFDAAFEDITVSDTTVTIEAGGSDAASTAGGVVGLLEDSTFGSTNVIESKIIDSSVDAETRISGAGALGGLIGKAFVKDDGVMIKTTSVDSTVDVKNVKNPGSNFGGLIGLADNSGPVTIDQTKFTGEVAGGANVGGFVGKIGTQLDITDSFSNAERYELDIDGGGLVGVIDGPMTVENTYAAGIDAAITDQNNEFGGIGGEVDNISDITIVNDSVYFDTDTGVPDVFDVDSSKDIPDVETPGASAMKGSSATSTMDEFDFTSDGIWETRTDDFPDLRTFN